MLKKEKNRKRRHFIIRKKIKGNNERPRIVIRRSLKNLHAQVINDLDGKVLCGFSTSSKALKQQTPYGGNIPAAKELGKVCLEALKEKGITKLSFDRGGYRYHGRIKAFADTLREGGIEF